MSIIMLAGVALLVVVGIGLFAYFSGGTEGGDDEKV